jgi:tetratricopeptide (TPR) repeat protein
LLLVGCLVPGCALFEVPPHHGGVSGLPGHRSTWQEPRRLTFSPHAEYQADYCPGAAALAYVSERDGNPDICIEEDVHLDHLAQGRGRRARLELPEPAIAHPARDTWPRFSPDGRRLVFISTRRDSAGDLWVLRRGWRPFGRRLVRLTGDTTADDQPCWHPDGRRIFYAAAGTTAGPYGLWEVGVGDGAPRSLGADGQMPDCSPDGRYLVFVSARAGSPDLWVLRLADGETVALTEGPQLDLYPCWSEQGERVYFVRHEFDTSDDGRLDLSDASSIFSVSFSPDLFAGGERPPPRQLTSYATSEGFPRALPGGFLFTGRSPAGRTDVFALGPGGELPEPATPRGRLRFARDPERGGDDVHHRLLAWRNAVWEARSPGADGLSPSQAAGAFLSLGRVLREWGRPEKARDALGTVTSRFGGELPQAGAARLELLALDREARSEWPPEAREEHLARAGALERDYLAHADEVGGAEGEELRRVAALARLETGRTHLSVGQYDSAIACFTGLRRDYPDQRATGAQALLGAAEVYRLLGQGEEPMDAYLRVLAEYPDLSPYVERAARRVLEIALRPRAGPEENLTTLREIVERHADAPLLPALAQNAIGDLLYARKDYLGALQQYRRTVEQFPRERETRAAAMLAIARIHAEREEYERAADILREMSAEYARDRGTFGRRARRELRRTLLLKARREVRLGDPGLALNTYSALDDLDQGSAAAHRGMVECYNLLGRIEEPIRDYRASLREGPDAHLARYGLALAYSYYGPADWVGDPAATARRVAIDREALALAEEAVLLAPRVAYYDQLHGFLLNRLAVATGEAEYKVRALDAYLTALGLSDPAADLQNHANLLFNVGEGYMLTEQPETAYGYYSRALEAGLPLVGARGGAAMRSISDSALAAGRYGHAIDLLERALALEDADDEVQRLRRRAETLDRLGLAQHLDARYAEAVRSYRQYAALLQRLIEREPDRAPMYRRNLLRACRNQAVNLYLDAERGLAGSDELIEAFGLLQEAVARLEAVGVVEWDGEGGPGLIRIGIEVTLGEGGGVARFDVAAEKRLLYSYMARISALAGDHAGAVRYLERKLALYPEAPESRPDLLTERAIVWTQIGRYRVAGASPAAAAAAYGRAAELERRAGNLEGEADAVVSLGRVVLRLQRGREDGGGDVLSEAIAVHRAVLERVRGRADARLAQTQAALETNLAALLTAGEETKR